jgi:hypothetical protein
MSDVDSGQVKLILVRLFRNDLGFIKSANLAGEMLSRVWSHSEGDNHVQRAICVLIYAASNLTKFAPDEREVAIYLWCHQKVVGKKSWWFFSVSDTFSEREAASEWLIAKAAELARLSGEIDYVRKFGRYREIIDEKLVRLILKATPQKPVRIVERLRTAPRTGQELRCMLT